MLECEGSKNNFLFDTIYRIKNEPIQERITAQRD